MKQTIDYLNFYFSDNNKLNDINDYLKNSEKPSLISQEESKLKEKIYKFKINDKFNYLSSKYSPKKESNRLLQNINSDIDIIFLLGVGNLYLTQDIINLSKKI